MIFTFGAETLQSQNSSCLILTQKWDNVNERVKITFVNLTVGSVPDCYFILPLQGSSVCHRTLIFLSPPFCTSFSNARVWPCWPCQTILSEWFRSPISETGFQPPKVSLNLNAQKSEKWLCVDFFLITRFSQDSWACKADTHPFCPQHMLIWIIPTFLASSSLRVRDFIAWGQHSFLLKC